MIARAGERETRRRGFRAGGGATEMLHPGRYGSSRPEVMTTCVCVYRRDPPMNIECFVGSTVFK